jgi:N-acetylmuramoyl-L-alanine amidase
MRANSRLRSAPLVGSLALALGLLGAPMAGADGPAGVRAVELRTEAGVTLLAVEAQAATAPPHTFFLAGPDRFVIDVPNARWALPSGRAAGEGPGAGVARRYRYANRPDGAARLVLDLSAPARLVAARRENAGRRLVFELSGAAAMTSHPHVSLVAAAPPPQAAEPPVDPAVSAPRRHVVVVDAGHGGRDPGALGLSGAREKDLALAAALRLRDALTARGYEVAMTRDDDTFIELADRVRFARERNAELFISLHADSSPGSQARGAAAYMLSERGEARSRRLMDTQDWHVDLGAAPRSGLIENILLDLTQRETTGRSAEFARLVLSELEAASLPILHRTPRNAGFFVLLAPDVPAVLVEMGFLTQAQDEARLADPRAQARLTNALADAVDAHFAGPRLVAERN